MSQVEKVETGSGALQGVTDVKEAPNRPSSIEVHVLNWTDDHATKEGEEPNVVLNGILKLDGQWIPWASDINIRTAGGDWGSVTVTFHPARIAVVGHDYPDWPPEGYPDSL